MELPEDTAFLVRLSQTGDHDLYFPAAGSQRRSVAFFPKRLNVALNRGEIGSRCTWPVFRIVLARRKMHRRKEVSSFNAKKGVSTAQLNDRRNLSLPGKEKRDDAYEDGSRFDGTEPVCTDALWICSRRDGEKRDAHEGQWRGIECAIRHYYREDSLGNDENCVDAHSPKS